MAKWNADELAQARKTLQAEARQRTAERGVLQFRADPETIKGVMRAAEEQQVPIGTLLRLWVQERLASMHFTPGEPDLVRRVTLLEEAVNELLSRKK